MFQMSVNAELEVCFPNKNIWWLNAFTVKYFFKQFETIEAFYFVCRNQLTHTFWRYGLKIRRCFFLASLFLHCDLMKQNLGISYQTKKNSCSSCLHLKSRNPFHGFLPLMLLKGELYFV